MVGVSKRVGSGLLTISLAVVGCSPSATNKPEPLPHRLLRASPQHQVPARDNGVPPANPPPGNRVWKTCRRESHRHRGRSRRFTLASIVTIWKARRANAQSQRGLAEAKSGSANRNRRSLDERGTNEYNLALGAKRAQAAKEYLITLGISPSGYRPSATAKRFRCVRSQTRVAGVKIAAHVL